jgi:hypothetical protein
MTFLPIILLLTPCYQQETVQTHLRMPVLGTIYHHKLYYSIETNDPRIFQIGAFKVKGTKAGAQERYRVLLRSLGLYNRYRIRFDRIWVSAGYGAVKCLSFDTLERFDQRKANAWEDYLKEYETPENGGEPDMMGLPALTKGKRASALSMGNFSTTLEHLVGMAIVPT